MSRIAIITVAGLSSRFNKGFSDEKKVLKCLYTERNERSTLLYHMVTNLAYADHIIVVGGYKYDELEAYIETSIEFGLKQKIRLVFNEHYEDLSSGYSLYLGLQAAFEAFDDITDILFAEGDLDVEMSSLKDVIDTSSTVLTYTQEPIEADKSVVLYIDGESQYRYEFNSSHGLLSIGSPFSAIYNSGQIWKFTEVEQLKPACETFVSWHREDTNLTIIQEYLNRIPSDSVVVMPLRCWTNCNTREDYRRIKERWDNENT